MLTIFTLPKPFTDPHIRTIQRNALMSWKKLHPEIEIFIMGKDPGIQETAEEFNMVWIPEVEVNEFGTPLLNSAFSIAKKKAKYDSLMYVNADIMFISDFIETLPRLPQQNSLTIGRRTDLDITYEINFNDKGWEQKLEKEVDEKGRLHSYAGIDYFIFNKNLLENLPAFAVGRPGWDNWTLREARKTCTYVIDATACITAIHENHDYVKSQSGILRKTSPEALKNRAFLPGRGHAYTIEDANWKLTKGGLSRNYFSRVPFIKRWIKSFL